MTIKVTHSQSTPVEIELSVSDENFVSLAQGKAKPEQLFMQGKIKVKGQIVKAMKLRTVLDPSMLKAKL